MICHERQTHYVADSMPALKAMAQQVVFSLPQFDQSMSNNTFRSTVILQNKISNEEYAALVNWRKSQFFVIAIC